MRADGTYMDGTFGRGGHSRLVLDRLGERGRLVGFDKDQEAVRAARQQFGGDPRFSMVHGSFTRIAAVAQELGLQRGVDGVLLDLGVSSPQLDEAGRGFSFMQDGPLDMRMDRTSGVSAAVISVPLRAWIGPRAMRRTRSPAGSIGPRPLSLCSG